MTTHSHVILNIALLSKRDKPFLHRYAFIGAVLPDLPLFIFFIIESIIRKTPNDELWGTRYFTEAWQNFFDIFNSVPLILILLGIGYYLLNSERITVFAWSLLMHCAFDLLTHNDDGHHHFYPLSNFAFESPISYWDRDHYAGIVAPIERVVFLIASIYLFRRLKTRLARWCLIIVNVLFVASYLLFFLFRSR
ncbi:hypothetical protein F4009_20285 [Candidatus Poribacteria bacterium]|nr:hypothetical protein [Candidatus Poribacteria bacterium]MYH82157.1 hypothetical protein [Candidatus Poribacteria bacterium]MYK96304.1 hypothetical protein [Candidatus Poribacteria bacterium]